MFVAILMLLFILHFFTGNAAVQHKNNAKNEPEDKEQLIKSDDEPQEYQKCADSEKEMNLSGAKIISPFANSGTKIVVDLTVSRSSESLESTDDEQLVGKYLPKNKSSKKPTAMKALKNRDEQDAKSDMIIIKKKMAKMSWLSKLQRRKC